MVFKLSLFITLVCLAALFAANTNWLDGGVPLVQFVFKVGVVSSIVAGLALAFDR